VSGLFTKYWIILVGSEREAVEPADGIERGSEEAAEGAGEVMNIIITNDIEQECLNLISMYTDIEYVKDRILQTYPNLSSKKQLSVAKKIKSHIDQANSFFLGTNDNVLTAPLSLFYAIQNYTKATFLVNYPNLSLAGAHGIDFDNDVAGQVNEVGQIKCKMTNKGTFGNLVTVTGDDLHASDSFVMKDIFSIIPELRETYYLRYFEEPNVFLLRKIKNGRSEYELILQDEKIRSIRNRDFQIFKKNGLHLECAGQKCYVWKDITYSEGKDEQIFYSDIYGNAYCTDPINVNRRAVKISKIVSLYLCYYTFSMLVRYYPDKWKVFCESSDIAIIRKLLINCRREMIVEVIQLLSGKKYFFSTILEEMDAGLDERRLFKLIKDEAWKEYRRTGRNPLLF